MQEESQSQVKYVTVKPVYSISCVRLFVVVELFPKRLVCSGCLSSFAIDKGGFYPTFGFDLTVVAIPPWHARATPPRIGRSSQAQP